MKQLLMAGLLVAACSTGSDDGAKRADRDRRIEDAKARHGPVIRTRIERARAIDRIYEGMTRPPITDEPPASDPRLASDNTDIVPERDLMMFGNGALARGATLLGYTPPGQDVTELDELLGRAARVTYVAVMRPSWRRPPEADMTHRTYSGGWASAEIVVFDLRTEPPHAIGAFRADAELHGKVRVRVEGGEKAVQEELDGALAGATFDAVRAKLRP
jgi:hypothetical protein